MKLIDFVNLINNMVYKSKRSYKKRRTSVRRKKTTYSKLDNDAAKQLSVYRYPHSKMTLCPKIPDGSAVLSTGVRYAKASSYTFETPTQYIVLFPGFTHYLAVYNDQSGDPVEGLIAGGGGMNPYPYFRSNEGEFPFNTPTSTVNVDSYARWRMVSAGLRVRCINSDDFNSGSWEAIRVPTSADITDYLKIRQNAPEVVGLNGVVRRLFSQLNNMQWSSQPSYVAGSLKDIHKRYFMLKEQTTAHDFYGFARKYGIDFTDAQSGMEAGDNPTYTGFEFVDTTPNQVESANDLIKAFNDFQMDTVVIKITGSSTPGAVTTLQLDGVANYEVEYIAGSEYTLFSSEGAYAPKHLASARESLRRKLIKAAI